MTDLALSLVPLFRIDSVLTEATVIGRGLGIVEEGYQILHASVAGERVSGTMRGRCTLDWMTGPGATATLRAHATIATHDGAKVQIRYEGKSDISEGRGAAPCFAAATFDTLDPATCGSTWSRGWAGESWRAAGSTGIGTRRGSRP